ncbi:MAG TPA: glycosyltransferase [Ohtaekwangia sp.]|uniref:glycosyltransferase n=1 Tax=Ohtaekwangia sp. TaxID=2066019 RepID=UPI002F91DE3C
MSERGVSVVICTYNGASKLPETIRHIANQCVPAHIPWEFIIVDNASTDETSRVAQHEWSKYTCNQQFTIVHEPQPGLSYARRKGFLSASYEYILLCDDDNWLDPHYIATVYEIMASHPNIGALGGYGSLVFEEEPPSWVRAFSIYAAGRQAPMSGPSKRFTLYGAGCVIRKSAYDILQHAGYRSLLTDRLGKELSSGGDYELCLALVIAGYTIWYDERLTFRHFITRDRITLEYYHKYLRESAKCFEVLNPYKIICEWKSLNVKSFRYRMAKSFFYLLRLYIRVSTLRLLQKKGSARHILLSLQIYSITAMVTVYWKNWNTIIQNYKHGKELQKKFSQSTGWNFWNAQASLSSIVKEI